MVEKVKVSKTKASVSKTKSSVSKTRARVTKTKKGTNKSKTECNSESRQGKRNVALGRRGEDAAAKFLYARGYEILERNWKCFAGEADIIARDEHCLVFVEVKTRKDTNRGFPSEAVNSEKRDKYEKIALAYVTDHDEADIPVRFDVISLVVVAPDRAMIRHTINAFSR